MTIVDTITPKARMLAVYGKGGMGKSFFTTNLVAKLALMGNRVLQLGCDPKHDSCNALFGGASLPTLSDTWHTLKAEGREHELRVHDVVFKTTIEKHKGTNATVFGCEIGGPDVGRGCGGRGISFGFDTLHQMGISQWALDYIVMDFLGDVVCGGFAMPLARSLAEEVIILCGNDRQSLYAANNIARATNYFASMGGRSRLLGVVINRDDGSGIAERFAERIGLPVLLKLPMSPIIRDLADSFQLALLDETFDALFDAIAHALINNTYATTNTTTPLDYTVFMQLFGASPSAHMPIGATADELNNWHTHDNQHNGQQHHTHGTHAHAAAPKSSIVSNGNGHFLHGVNNVDVLDPSHCPVLNMPIASSMTETIDTSIQQLVARLSNELGLYITDVSIDPKKGLMLTIDGNITICFGDDQDQERESKIAVLDALQESGEPYHYIDVRNPASPYYR